jgi:hypothetical protein
MFLEKRIHKWLGILLYALGKWQILTGKWSVGIIKSGGSDKVAYEHMLNGFETVIGVLGVRVLIELFYRFPPQVTNTKQLKFSVSF